MAVKKRKQKSARALLGMGKAQLLEFAPNELDPALYNPRQITDAARDGLKASMKKFGCVEPIIVNIKGGKRTIVSGHRRHEIMLEAGAKKCTCVAVDLSVSDEKLLNVTMNNPNIQGRFADDIEGYIDQLRRSLTNDSDYFDLRIYELTQDIAKNDHLDFREVALKPYKKTHVLLSFPSHKWPEVKNAIVKLIRDEDIEYEQSAN